MCRARAGVGASPRTTLSTSSRASARAKVSAGWCSTRRDAHQQVHHLRKLQRQRIGRNNGVAPLFQELGNDFTGVARAAQHRNILQFIAVAQGLLHQL
jgi:2-iminoacetate synthase ThiH